MVFRFAAGLLGAGIFWILVSGYQDGEFTPKNVIMMLSVAGIFLAYAIIGPKRLRKMYTSVVGEDGANPEGEDQEGEIKRKNKG